MASNNEECYWKYAYIAEATKLNNNFIANARTKVTYRNWTRHFGQCESSRQKLAAKVVKTKLN